MKTAVINIWGGPGKGKSTLAAGIFHELKKNHYDVELVTEAAKDIVWAGHSIQSQFDQLDVSLDQIRREARLYGKVKYIVTDSPLMLAAFYAGKHSLSEALITIVDLHKEGEGIQNINVIVETPVKFSAKGRFQKNVMERDSIHKELKEWLVDCGINVESLKSIDPAKALTQILPLIK